MQHNEYLLVVNWGLIERQLEHCGQFIKFDIYIPSSIVCAVTGSDNGPGPT